MSPGTMNHQIFIVILFLPAAIISAVCCSNHTFIKTKYHLTWRSKFCLEDLNVLEDQKDYNLNMNGKFTVITEITSTYI